MRAIGKVAVIGAGVMGAGIAAQVANAGYPALLLDMTAELARTAREQLGRRAPPAFMHDSAEPLVTARGLEEGLEELATCDWIIEAVVEDAEIKRGLYRRIMPHVASHAALSSNTSTIRRADLAASLPDAMARRFLITHFFNPPRTMRLLELVAGLDVEAGALDAVSSFADRALGKTVVHCRDRPGFIANRLGCFWMQAAIALACEQCLKVEEADAVMGEPFGIPKTGVFGLADLVGVDLMPKVNGSLAAALEKEDLFQTVNRPVRAVERMIDAGLTGRKAGGGFYRLQRGPGQGKEAIDLVSLTYRPLAPVRLGESAELFGSAGRLGRYGTAVMARTLAYAGHLVGDAAEDAAAIDAAMRLGYNWRWGPFELADRIGLDRLRAEIAAAGLVLPPFLEKAGKGPIHRGAMTLQRDGTYTKRSQPAGILSLVDIKAAARPVLAKSPLPLWPLGAGMFCLEFAAPLGLMDLPVLDGLAEALDHVEGHGRALVIYGDGDHFSTGAEMTILANLIREGNWSALTSLIARAQAVLDRLKRAPFPSVAALFGISVGNGLELALHCTGIQAHAESNVGFLEASAGLIPALGGCSELLSRMHDAKPRAEAVRMALDQLVAAKLSHSAAWARDMFYLRPSDGITMNRSRLLADARERAARLLQDGEPGFNSQRLSSTLNQGESHIDAGSVPAIEERPPAIHALAKVLSAFSIGDGDRATGNDAHAVAREEFLKLARRPETLELLTRARGARSRS